MSAAADLIDLWADIEDDPRLRTEGMRPVPGIGTYPTNVMVVGEAPGAVESTHERPFLGVPGQVLRQLMDVAGLRAEDQPPDDEFPGVDRHANCWLTYTVKTRTPDGRPPNIRDILDAQPYLRREWMIVGRPRILVAVGSVAWQALGPVTLGGITSNAGNPVWIKGERYIWPMLHPAYGLRNPEAQPKMERDWEHLGQWLREENIV